MLWYGRGAKTTYKKTYKKRLQRYHLMVRRLAFSIEKNTNLGHKVYYFHIPANWHVVALQMKLLIHNPNIFYLTSTTYFFKVIVPSHQLKWWYDLQTNTILFSIPKSSNFFNMYWKLLQALLYSFNNFYFLKLKFKGKGYYLYKNIRNTITPQFGHSHRIYIYSFAITVKFLSKTSVMFFGLSKKDVLKTGYQLRKSRSVNLFTGRGVRFNRQILYRKTGKVSTHR
jgi:ribosomal protein L6P/L9E